MANPGRPGRLDDITAARLVQAVEKGLPRVTAAKIAGVSPRAFFNWLRLGREGASPAYVQFVQRIAVAEAKGEEELMGYMREHARTSHQACAWLLERRNPKAYSLRKVVAEEQPLTPEQAHKLVAEAAALLSTSRQEPPR